MTLQYLNFDVQVGEGQGQEYPLVVASPAGEARVTLRFPFDKQELETRLEALQEGQGAQDLGQALFDALISGDVRSLYDVSLAKVAESRQGLRLKLRIASPALAAVPWEFLYDARRGQFVCLSVNTPIVRYLELPQPPQSLKVTLPLRILGMIASTSDFATLNIDEEKARVEDALSSLRAKGLVDLEWLPGQTWRDLQKGMRRGPWHIFHFVGHGAFDAEANEGLVMLADEQGKARLLRATELGSLLADHRDLRLAVLNACEGAKGGKRDIFSSTASILVRQGLPAVLAMQSAISDGAAIELSRTFYESLADGLSVDAALAEARKAVSLAEANTVEWGAPVLTMRAPDGKIFDVPGVEESALTPVETPFKGRQDVVGEQSRKGPKPPKPAGTTWSPDGLKTTSRLNMTSPFDMELVSVPAGPFLMGTRTDQIESLLEKYQGKREEYMWETEQYPLVLPEFYVARTMVTVEQFDAFVKATRHQTTAELAGWGCVRIDGQWEKVDRAFWREPRGPGSHTKVKRRHPVTQVSFRDVEAFCKWLRENVDSEVQAFLDTRGWELRMPTEPEWEKAARGEKGKLFPWGNEKPSEKRCNFGMRLQDTTPVDAYPYGQSQYGVFDMAGNVWEWTATSWNSREEQPPYGYPYHPDQNREDPSEDPNGEEPRVMRGGSFHDKEWIIRCAFRHRHPEIRSIDCGSFRVALGAPR